jgi:hypothetical protein
MNEKISADHFKAKALKAALNGGRKYGTSEHKVAIKNLAILIGINEADDDLIIDAIVSLSNISATQQWLAKKGFIDRETREAKQASILADLMA